jgi:hypothetical protein
MKRLLAVALVFSFCVSAWAEAPPAADNTGAVKVATPGLALRILGPKNNATGKPDEISLPIGQEVKLPPAAYPVSSITLMAPDAGKNLWILAATKNLGRLDNIQVTAGQTTTVEGGGPLQIRANTKTNAGAAPAARVPTYGYGMANVPGMGYANYGGSGGSGNKEQQANASKYAPKNQAGQGKTATVLIEYVGQAGEVYSPCARKGKGICPAPVVRIVDEKNNVIAQGLYSFGASANMTGNTGNNTGYNNMGAPNGNINIPEGYSWRIPANFKGMYRVEVMSTMPFQYKQDTTTHSVD